MGMGFGRSWRAQDVLNGDGSWGGAAVVRPGPVRVGSAGLLGLLCERKNVALMRFCVTKGKGSGGNG